MLARRLTTMLSDLTLAEAIETTRVHSMVLTGGRSVLVARLPAAASKSNGGNRSVIREGYSDNCQYIDGVQSIDHLTHYRPYSLAIESSPKPS
jgi:Magnesium chelatase, subunit ChlI